MSKYFFSLFIFFVLGLSNFPDRLSSASLHLMMVGDTNAAELRQSINLDLKNVRQWMSNAAQNIGYTLDVITLRDNAAAPFSVLHTVENLDITDSDIAVFYFSGHGYRTHSKGESPWPYFAFVKQYEGVDMDDILLMYREKSPALLLVVADCCNNFMSDTFAPPVISKDVLAERSAKLKKINYKRLFVETKGEILISGAVPGEFSWSTTTGGLYTNAFLASLNSAINSKNTIPNWQSILDLTAKAIHDYQNPYYVVTLLPDSQ